MKSRNLLLLLILFVTAALFFALSTQLSPVGRFIPFPLSLAVLMLCLWEIIRPRPDVEEELQPIQDRVPKARNASSEWTFILWLGGFLAAVLLLGLVVASLLFTISYLHWAAGRSWKFSLTSGVAIGLFLALPLLLDVPLYPGVLWVSWLT